jgi:hypothetical protein
MKEKIRKLFKFTGFGNFDKVFGLTFILIVFIIVMYFFCTSTFMI